MKCHFQLIFNFFYGCTQIIYSIHKLFTTIDHVDINTVFSFFCMLQVVDATNTTRERRKLLFEIIQVKHKFKLFFIESICDDPTIVEANVLVSPCSTRPLVLSLQELSFFLSTNLMMICMYMKNY